MACIAFRADSGFYSPLPATYMPILQNYFFNKKCTNIVQLCASHSWSVWAEVPRAAERALDSVAYFCLGFYIALAHCSWTLLLHIALVHCPSTLLCYIAQVHCSGTLLKYIALLHCSCTLHRAPDSAAAFYFCLRSNSSLIQIHSTVVLVHCTLKFSVLYTFCICRVGS